MGLSEDLGPEALAAALPDRPFRCYPAVVSTEADALAWAHAGAPEGAVVTAGYQAAPRGRGGREWHLDSASALAFSLVLRPDLPPEEEGWLYTVAASGLASALGEAKIEWPDEVLRADDEVVAGAVAVRCELGGEGDAWAVVSAMVARAEPPRARLLARVVRHIEDRYRAARAPVLDDYLRRCSTLGRRVCARLVPAGPGGVRVEGRAGGSRMDGSLVIVTDDGRRVAVPPQALASLEFLDGGGDSNGPQRADADG